MTKSLHQVALGVANLDVAAEFYSAKLGLRELGRFDPPGLVFFELSGTRLLLECSSTPSPGSGVLYLTVESIDEQYKNLSAKGVDFSSPPQLIHVDSNGEFGERGSEEWMAFFKDPDGNHLALVERRPSSAA